MVPTQRPHCYGQAAGLKGLRFHDLRHHATTEFAESQASDQTTMAIAGHVSPKMLAHYSHVRLEAKRRALDALSSMPSEAVKGEGLEGGYVTKNVTNTPSGPTPIPQVFEKYGGDDGTRTRDLCRDREAPEYYLVGSSSSFLHLASRFCMVFGSEWTQVGPKFGAHTTVLMGKHERFGFVSPGTSWRH